MADDEGRGAITRFTVVGRVENPQCVGALLKHLIDGHGELLGGRASRLVPGHESFALDEKFLRPRLDGEHLGNREAGDEESACHDLFAFPSGIVPRTVQPNVNLECFVGFWCKPYIKFGVVSNLGASKRF